MQPEMSTEMPEPISITARNILAKQQETILRAPTPNSTIALKMAKMVEEAKAKFGNAIKGLKELDLKELPPALIQYVKENSRATAFQLALLLVAAFPGLIVTPGLFLLGFGPLGPVAGFLAPAIQSLAGTPWLFRVVQSAAMGGWGAAILGGVVQGAAATAAVVLEFVKRQDAAENVTQAAVEDTSQDDEDARKTKIGA